MQGDIQPAHEWTDEEIALYFPEMILPQLTPAEQAAQVESMMTDEDREAVRRSQEIDHPTPREPVESLYPPKPKYRDMYEGNWNF